MPSRVANELEELPHVIPLPSRKVEVLGSMSRVYGFRSEERDALASTHTPHGGISKGTCLLYR